MTGDWERHLHLVEEEPACVSFATAADRTRLAEVFGADLSTALSEDEAWAWEATLSQAETGVGGLVRFATGFTWLVYAVDGRRVYRFVLCSRISTGPRILRSPRCAGCRSGTSSSAGPPRSRSSSGSWACA